MEKKYKVIGKPYFGNELVTIDSNLDLVAAQEVKKKYEIFSSFTSVDVQEDKERTGENIFSQHKFYF